MNHAVVDCSTLTDADIHSMSWDKLRAVTLQMAAQLRPASTNAPAGEPHHRDVAMQSAGAELTNYLRDWVGRHAVTPVEYLHVLNLCIRIQLRQLGLDERAALLAKTNGASA